MNFRRFDLARLVQYSTFTLVSAALPLMVGCEGWDRKHDSRVVDISPPKDDAPPVEAAEAKHVANFSDMIEDVASTRQALLDKLMKLERAYLQAGDSIHADWARRQRDLTAGVMMYPYLTAEAPEQRADVRPVDSIPEADAIYKQATAILKDVRAIPLAGALTYNKNKAREALALFKKVIKEYPHSDKVDDCAYYCGDIYKEYLREDDPNDELSIRYYKWAVMLDPNTPHRARFQAAVVYDFRRHERAKALELYHQVMDMKEANSASDVRFSATRIEQLTDEDFSHLKPEPSNRRPTPPEAEPRTAHEDTAKDLPDAETAPRPARTNPAPKPSSAARPTSLKERPAPKEPPAGDRDIEPETAPGN